MAGSLSLGGLSSLGLEEGAEAEMVDPAVEDRLRIPPLVTPATGPEPNPPLRFLPDTENDDAGVGLLAELCLLS